MKLSGGIRGAGEEMEGEEMDQNKRHTLTFHTRAFVNKETVVSARSQQSLKFKDGTYLSSEGALGERGGISEFISGYK